MTYEQAVALRAHQLQGFRVDPVAAAEAFEIIRTTRPKAPRSPQHKRQGVVVKPDAADRITAEQVSFAGEDSE